MFQIKGSSITQLMGQLPLECVTVAHPLLSTGIDYVGQFEIKVAIPEAKL
jgi:hypothetical protein